MQALIRLSLISKVIFLTIPTAVFALLYCVIGSALKLRKRKTTGQLTQISTNVHSVKYYVGPGEICSECIVYRVPKTRNLILFSPFPPSKESIGMLSSLGTVSYVVVPNSGHDSQAHLWPIVEPQCKALCFEAQRSSLEKANRKMNDVCENILPSFGISWHRVPGTNNGFIEYIIVLPLESVEKKFAILFCDVIQNHVAFQSFSEHLFSFITGWYGLGFARFFRCFFIANPPELKKFIMALLCLVVKFQK